eukprot:4188314-Heterocapsa_arctica.AAC.1
MICFVGFGGPGRCRAETTGAKDMEILLSGGRNAAKRRQISLRVSGRPTPTYARRRTWHPPPTQLGP